MLEIEATFEKVTKRMVRYTTEEDGTFYFRQDRFPNGKYPEHLTVRVDLDGE